jgi:hypothetical protein
MGFRWTRPTSILESILKRPADRGNVWKVGSSRRRIGRKSLNKKELAAQKGSFTSRTPELDPEPKPKLRVRTSSTSEA